jgi:hypothetical protein
MVTLTVSPSKATPSPVGPVADFAIPMPCAAGPTPAGSRAATGKAMPNMETSIANMTTIGKNILILFFILFLLSITFLCIPYFCCLMPSSTPIQITLPAAHKVFRELTITLQQSYSSFVKQKTDFYGSRFHYWLAITRVTSYGL